MGEYLPTAPLTLGLNGLVVAYLWKICFPLAWILADFFSLSVWISKLLPQCVKVCLSFHQFH